MIQRPVILDFKRRRSWMPGDVGYEERLAESLRLIADTAHRFIASGSQPPERQHEEDA